ncbi:MAG: T9SS type A sorting domain-containing protein, partial [Bacteroidetes bacterium]|nr:T9SS type A sorting domain-containing protein [Bacteroidota bacterium]
NNNMYWDQEYKDLWAANSAKVAAPGTLTPTIIGALEGSADDAVMEEALVFTVAPPSFLPYTTDAFMDPRPEPMAENFYFAEDVDLAYGMEAASYTAGDKDFPLGDLNHYPDMKALWESGGSPVAIEDKFNTEKLNMTTFPNPFSGQATLRFSLDQSSLVSVDIYDITGKSVKRIDAGYFSSGENTLTIQQGGLISGIYILKLNTGSNRGVMKISVK